MTLDNKMVVAYDEASEAGRAREAFLRVAAAALMTGAVLSLIFQRLVVPEQSVRAVGPVMIIGVILVSHYLMTQGRQRAALYLMVAGNWCALTVVVALTNGVHAPMISAYPVLILATGWLIGAHAALYMAGLTVAVTIGLALAEFNGLLILLDKTPIALRTAMQIFVYVIAAVLVFYAMRSMHRREERLRQVHQALMQRTMELSVSQEELSAAQAVAKMGSLVYDFSSGTADFSAETGRILGVGPEALQNRKPDLSRVHREDRVHVQQAYDAALSGKPFDIEYRVLLGDGVRTVRSKGDVTCAADGSPLKALATVQDITERKIIEVALLTAKAEAEQANRAKSSFLAAVTHDLGQPISAIALMIDVLEQSAQEVPRKLVHNMQVCVREMSGMLADLMEISKLDAGVALPSFSDWSVQDILAAIVSVHVESARKKGVQLYLRHTDAWTYTDRKLLQRLVGNLVSNAIRYTNAGSVMVACRWHGGKRWIEVWDTGIGIAQDQLNRVFEEFAQVNRDEKAAGSGLGLSIVAKTSQLLGLEIRCRSNLGRGSMFAVELPAERSRAISLPPEMPLPERPGRIGLVEDNPFLLESLIFALEAKGHQVVAASTASELLKQMGEQRLDALISDYHLGSGETGADVIDAVRLVCGSQLPCLIITADSRVEHRRTLATRRVSVMQKPLNFNDILAFVHKATGHDKPDAVTDDGQGGS
jgi:signal transduction histidine kinase/CheY-like chemotaxis protein